jgi:hypothetical protein
MVLLGWSLPFAHPLRIPIILFAWLAVLAGFCSPRLMGRVGSRAGCVVRYAANAGHSRTGPPAIRSQGKAICGITSTVIFITSGYRIEGRA